MTMNREQEELRKFFADKAEHLQKEIDLEIANIGGADMLVSREDLIHWVFYARDQIETYHTICRMLEDREENADTDSILRELRETVTEDQSEIRKLEKKQEEEKRALEQLRKEEEYYSRALRLLDT